MNEIRKREKTFVGAELFVVIVVFYSNKRGLIFLLLLIREEKMPMHGGRGRERGPGKKNVLGYFGFCTVSQRQSDYVLSFSLLEPVT